MAILWPVAVVLPIVLVVGAAPTAWGQLTPIAPPPLAPPPPPAAPEPPPGPPAQPPPGEAPALPEGAPAPLPGPGITAPRPPEFEFIEQEPLRPDPTLLLNPLALPRGYLIRAVLSEEADDNVRLAPGGHKQGDLSTIASLVGMYRYQTERTFLQTMNSLSARYSPRFSDRQGISFANLNIVGGHQLTPRFFLGFSEAFAKSNDLLQAGSTTTTTAAPTVTPSGRAEFLRNSFSPQAAYRLSDLTTLTVRWANILLEPEGDSQGTGGSTTNTFSGTLAHHLGQRTTGTLGYSHLISKSRGNNLTGDDVTGGLTYLLTPITTLTLNASAAFRNAETRANQNIYGLSLGAGRQFSPTLHAAASVGLQVFEAAGRNDVKPTFNLSLTKDGLHYRVQASASMATSENIGQVNDVGLTRHQIVTVSYIYFPSQIWFLTLGATYARTDFSQAQRASLLGIQQSTIDRVFSFLAAVDYRLSRPLSVRLSYNLFVRDSSQIGRDASDNRVTLSLIGEFGR